MNYQSRSLYGCICFIHSRCPGHWFVMRAETGGCCQRYKPPGHNLSKPTSRSYILISDLESAFTRSCRCREPQDWRYYLSTCLEGLIRAIRLLRQDVWSLGRDSNPALPKYKSKVTWEPMIFIFTKGHTFPNFDTTEMCLQTYLLTC
jgi:hypothetical protein